MPESAKTEFDEASYRAVRDENAAWFEFTGDGVISVSGEEAIQFLDGLLTNDVKLLEEGRWMLAAFPNAKGRLLALAKIYRDGGEFIFETGSSTYEKVLTNLERFTLAGDFKVVDLTERYSVIGLRGSSSTESAADVLNIDPSGIGATEVKAVAVDGIDLVVSRSVRPEGFDLRVARSSENALADVLIANGAVRAERDLAEVLRIESGLPVYGVDMDEDTVVPEIGIDGLISYNKGCYIGQEVIARIHFRGKVAKELTGLIFDEPDAAVKPGDDIVSDGKNAGKLTSVAFSPKIGRTIALAYVRNAFLEPGTELFSSDHSCRVANLPFIE